MLNGGMLLCRDTCGQRTPPFPTLVFPTTRLLDALQSANIAPAETSAAYAVVAHLDYITTAAVTEALTTAGLSKSAVGKVSLTFRRLPGSGVPVADFPRCVFSIYAALEAMASVGIHVDPRHNVYAELLRLDSVTNAQLVDALLAADVLYTDIGRVQSALLTTVASSAASVEVRIRIAFFVDTIPMQCPCQFSCY